MRRHTTRRSRASWPAFRCGERSTSLPVRRRPCHFPPRAIRVSTSSIRRSGGRSVWARIRSTACRWRLPSMMRSPIGPARRSAYAASAPTSRQQGYRQFVINGKPVLIRGAGWAPDMFLRDDPKRMEAEFSYVVNLGLNTIRSEGKLEDARFYDLADRDGIMILAGWECCDKWESWAKTGGEPWDAADEKVAAASMASEARLLRNHPSVIGFLIGSDNAPPAAISKMYVDTLHAEDWSLPIIAAAVAAGHGRDRSVRHEDGRALLVDSAGVLVCRQAGRRLRVRLRSQRGRLHSAAGRPDPHALAAGAGGTVEISPGAAVSRVGRLVGIRDDRAVRHCAGQALRPTQEPRGLRRQVAARQLRQRPSAIRGVQCAHGCGQALDRRHLLDAQQRLALAALASVRLFPESGRRLLRRQDCQRAGAHPVLIRHARDHVGQSHAHQ